MNLKQYFQSRLGKTLIWSFSPAQVKVGMPARRDYSIEPEQVDGKTLTAFIGYTDWDQSDKKINTARKNLGSVSIEIDATLSPMEILENLARQADHEFFKKQPRLQKTSLSLEDKIAELLLPENKVQGEKEPLPISLERLRKFWQQNPGLILPDIFSSGPGIIRVRWMHGDTRSVWLNFPPEGPLGWSLQIPRETSSGLRKLNARCPNDEDIVSFIELLGIRIKRV